MQKVIRQVPNIHPIFDDIDNLFEITSEPADTQIGLIPPTFDKSFKPLVDVFNTYGLENYVMDYMDFDYTQIDTREFDSKNIILAFSGGKDSIAACLKYKEQGYNVYLYHLKHINPSISDEYIISESLAKLLDVPLYVDDVRFKGHHMWMEHPMKNMIIATGALNYGITHKIGTKVAFGNYTTSILPDNPFDRCAGDCMDMWDCYNNIIQRVIPNFEIMCTLSHMGETLDIMAKHLDLLDESISCLCRHSLRPYRHNWVKEKFGIDLPKHRCGSCYKCVVEYIYMTDHNAIEFNEDYYKYCMGQLLNVAYMEGTPAFSMQTLWNKFMFYPMCESKLHIKLLSAIPLRRKILW